MVVRNHMSQPLPGRLYRPLWALPLTSPPLLQWMLPPRDCKTCLPGTPSSPHHPKVQGRMKFLCSSSTSMQSTRQFSSSKGEVKDQVLLPLNEELAPEPHTYARDEIHKSKFYFSPLTSPGPVGRRGKFTAMQICLGEGK